VVDLSFEFIIFKVKLAGPPSLTLRMRKLGADSVAHQPTGEVSLSEHFPHSPPTTAASVRARQRGMARPQCNAFSSTCLALIALPASRYYNESLLAINARQVHRNDMPYDFV
jgi:hypothetical protein